MKQQESTLPRLSFVSSKRPLERAKPEKLTREELKLCNEIAQVYGVTKRVIVTFAEGLAASPETYRLAERMQVLGLAGDDLPEVNSIGGLVELELGAESIAAVLATCRAFPMSDGKSTLVGHFRAAGLIELGTTDRILLESLRGGVSPLRYAIEKGLIRTGAAMEALSEFAGQTLADRSAREGESAANSAELQRLTELFGILPWHSKQGALLLLADRPVLDYVAELFGRELDTGPQIRLVSPRVLDARLQRLGPIPPRESKTSKGNLIGSPFALHRNDLARDTPRKGEPVVPLEDESETLETTPNTGGLFTRRAPGTAPHVPAPWLARGPIAQRVREIIESALDRRATDIHFDPFPDHVRVRIRVDGMLHEVYRIAGDMRREVIARLKILADLDITERRRPQDGQISVTVAGSKLDMRVATIPVTHGERLELRLANMVRLVSDLSELGLEEENQQILEGLLGQPHGIILSTGPVGSGKTTTLYSCLTMIDSNSYNLMSIEDPVEVDLAGVNQVNVNYKIQFDFVRGMRGLLRHDPDVILIGEIRDEETAKIAIRAAMTGMLVFSSLHTNDAPGAVTTLYNFNLPPHLVANGLLGVIAQRLARVLCHKCSVEHHPNAEELAYLFAEHESRPEKVVTRAARGCAECLHTGYYGRTGFFEVLKITPALRDMVLEERSERDLRSRARAEGMATLHEGARRKVLRGITSIDEMARVLGH